MPSELVNNYSSLPVLQNSSVNPIGSSGGNWFTKFLSNILPFGGLLDAGIGLISGISNNVYDRQLQKTIFERDDTQLTRLMNEYKRNGLNPLLGLPGASVGNTKGFEPSPIQTNFNQSYANKLAMDRLKIDNWKAKEDLKVARYDAEIRGYEAQQKRINSELEAKILKGKINAQVTNRADYYDDQDKYKLPYSDSDIGVDYTGMTEHEKIARYIYNATMGGKSEEAKLVESAKSYIDDGVLTVDKDAKNSFIFEHGGKKFYMPVSPAGYIRLVASDGRLIGDFTNFKDAINYAKDWSVMPW